VLAAEGAPRSPGVRKPLQGRDLRMSRKCPWGGIGRTPLGWHAIRATSPAATPRARVWLRRSPLRRSAGPGRGCRPSPRGRPLGKVARHASRSHGQGSGGKTAAAPCNLLPAPGATMHVHERRPYQTKQPPKVNVSILPSTARRAQREQAEWKELDGLRRQIAVQGVPEGGHSEA
jgi:hypothetical protein